MVEIEWSKESNMRRREGEEQKGNAANKQNKGGGVWKEGDKEGKR